MGDRDGDWQGGAGGQGRAVLNLQWGGAQACGSLGDMLGCEGRAAGHMMLIPSPQWSVSGWYWHHMALALPHSFHPSWKLEEGLLSSFGICACSETFRMHEALP